MQQKRSYSTVYMFFHTLLKARNNLEIPHFKAFPESLWESLKNMDFALPTLYFLLKDEPYRNAIPAEVFECAKNHFYQNLGINEIRFKLIRKLSQDLHQLEKPIVFIKGAAELAEFYDDPYFLGLRIMHDLDFICHARDMAFIHQYLLDEGHILHDYALQDASETAIQEFSLKQYKHYVYDNNSRLRLELHNDVVSFADDPSYPPHFGVSMMEQHHSIVRGGVGIPVPLREHTFIHLLCQVSSLKDNNYLHSLNRDYWDYYGSQEIERHPLKVLHATFDEHWIRYLSKLLSFLEASSNPVDYTIVKELLSQVPEQTLLNLYLDLGRFYFPDQLAMGNPKTTLARLFQQRQNWICKQRSDLRPRSLPVNLYRFLSQRVTAWQTPNSPERP